MHAEENTAHRNGIYDAELALERNRVADLRHLREAIAGLSNSEVALEQLGYRREAIRFIALKARLASIRYPEKANGILLKAGREIARLVPNPSLVNPDEIRDKIAARVIRDISEGDMRVDVRGRDIGHFIIQALRPNLVVNPKSGKLHGKPLDLKKREDHIYHTVDCTELILAWPKIYDNPVTLAITATPCKADPEDIRAMARLM